MAADVNVGIMQKKESNMRGKGKKRKHRVRFATLPRSFSNPHLHVNGHSLGSMTPTWSEYYPVVQTEIRLGVDLEDYALSLWLMDTTHRTTGRSDGHTTDWIWWQIAQLIRPSDGTGHPGNPAHPSSTFVGEHAVLWFVRHNGWLEIRV